MPELSTITTCDPSLISIIERVLIYIIKTMSIPNKVNQAIEQELNKMIVEGAIINAGTSAMKSG